MSVLSLVSADLLSDKNTSSLRAMLEKRVNLGNAPGTELEKAVTDVMERLRVPNVTLSIFIEIKRKLPGEALRH